MDDATRRGDVSTDDTGDDPNDDARTTEVAAGDGLGPLATGSADPEDDGVSQAEVYQAAALVGARAERLVEDLLETELATGKHEESVEEAKRHIIVRVVRIVAGVVVLLLGIALLGLPGPGLLVIALGLGLLAQDVPFARNLLDRVRARLPQDADGKLPRSTIIMMVVVGVGAVALSIGFTVWRMSGS